MGRFSWLWLNNSDKEVIKYDLIIVSSDSE